MKKLDVLSGEFLQWTHDYKLKLGYEFGQRIRERPPNMARRSGRGGWARKRAHSGRFSAEEGQEVEALSRPVRLAQAEVVCFPTRIDKLLLRLFFVLCIWL
ncbi:MAG: hypothetical protein ACK4VW_03665 [Anaerolineales bacterium]